MKYCKLKSIKKIQSEDRYDFEVEKNNNFFANDILVHNCRCLVTAEGMFSRLGKPFVSAPHIYEELTKWFEITPGMVFDGELYNHDYKDDFNTIISLSKQSKPTYEDLELSKKNIQYHIYDVCYKNDLTFSKRYLNSISLFGWDTREFNKKDSCIKLVKTDLIKSFEHLDQLYAEYLEEGYEGQMVRIDNSKYENKRTNQLLKRKEFQDDEFEVLRIEEGKGNRSGMAGRVVYNLKDGTGRTFESNLRGNYDYYTKLLKEEKEYVGGVGTVRFFNYTPDGKPRFPVTVALFKKKDGRDV